MRTVHGIDIKNMTPEEKDAWLRRYTELLVDAQKRNDYYAVDLYRREVQKLVNR